MFAVPALGGFSTLAGNHADVIIIGTTDSIEASLDNALAYDYFGWEIITSVSSGLVDIKPGSQAGASDIVPALATSWVMSGSGLVWDFQLRHGVTYDGVKPFNATCVKYTFDRNCNLTGTGLAEPDGPQVNIGYSDIIRNVTALGTYSVRFNLKTPFAPFLQLMACAASYIVDPTLAPMHSLVNYIGGNPKASCPMALGPYLLQKWDRVAGADREIDLIKNPYYFNASAGYPKTNQIIIKMYSDATALATAMAAGEIDIAYRQLLPTAVDLFRTNAAVKVWEGVGAQIQYMCFQERIPPFNNVNVRRAIAACLNRTEVCNTVFLRTAQPLYSIIPNGLAYHKDSFLKYGSANYTYAKALLSPLGYNASNKLTIDLWYESSGHYPSSPNQALVYASGLEASGVISVTLHSASWATYKISRDNAIMSMFAYGWYPDYLDADDYAFLPFASWLNMAYNQTYPTGGVQQYGYWLAGRSATTDAARYGNYTILQDLQASEVSMIPLWQKSNAMVTRLSVSGVSLDITARLYLSLLTMNLSTTTTTTATTTTTTTTTTSTTTTGNTGTTSGSWGLISTVVTIASIAVIVVFTIAIVCRRR